MFRHIFLPLSHRVNITTIIVFIIMMLSVQYHGMEKMPQAVMGFTVALFLSLGVELNQREKFFTKRYLELDYPRIGMFKTYMWNAAAMYADGFLRLFYLSWAMKAGTGKSWMEWIIEPSPNSEFFTVGYIGCYIVLLPLISLGFDKLEEPFQPKPLD